MSGTQEFKQTINDYDRREKKAIAMSPQFSLKSTVGASDWRGRSVSVATRIQKQPAIVHFHTTAPRRKQERRMNDAILDQHSRTIIRAHQPVKGNEIRTARRHHLGERLKGCSLLLQGREELPSCVLWGGKGMLMEGLKDRLIVGSWFRIGQRTPLHRMLVLVLPKLHRSLR